MIEYLNCDQWLNVYERMEVTRRDEHAALTMFSGIDPERGPVTLILNDGVTLDGAVLISG